MKAIKIKMKPGCHASNNLVEIDEIYLVGAGKEGFYKKADVHDYLKKNPDSIQVNIYPYPNCIPVTSIYGEKYVKSSPNNSQRDNLLNLPRV
ncbi:DUF3892 domain-containing protein [Christensenellaceae bacterium OttesenSCG-928-L17]|nr:DUF3892 domain-containing protein [Christensenellaceae bacterium OttesenSCG-928-L17]